MCYFYFKLLLSALKYNTMQYILPDSIISTFMINCIKMIQKPPSFYEIAQFRNNVNILEIVDIECFPDYL